MEKKKYIKPRTISREELERALLEANEELSLANEKLRRQEKERAELFRNLSHDLRAPMTALVSTVDYLKEKRDLEEAEYQELLNLMSRRLKNLNAIMDEIFLMGQMENPELKLQTEEIDAALLLEEFFYSCVADIKYEKRKLSLELPPDLHCLVTVDPQKIVRVLDNLFTNALRYSDEGDEIRLKAGISSADNGRQVLVIEVEDTGMGIRQEDLPHIFERTYRADRSRTPGDGGYGLGLAIARSIMQRHGGAIDCTSQVGKGSCFKLMLPCD